MNRRVLTAMAALSVALAPMAAQAAAPVRAGAASVAAKPVRGISAGDRVGAKKPADASKLEGGSTLWVLLLALVAVGAVVVVSGGDSSSPN